VRWLKADGAGLEFAHETCIECDLETRNQLLRNVIRKSFPDVEIALEVPACHEEETAPADSNSAIHPRADRHPLVWSGMIYYDEGEDRAAEPVRLRNISATGAQVQSGNPLAEGMTVHLDMRATGRHEAVVKWTRGDHSGLEFCTPFDLHSLADSAPQITGATNSPAPEFGTQEPWAPGWRRSSIGELARDLGR
jgi:PilZ domain-containing protein